MIVFIKTLTGKTISIDVEPTDNIGSIKKKITDREAVPVDQQRVLFAGKELADEKTVDECGIKKEVILHLVLRKKEENLKQLSAFEKAELTMAHSSKLKSFYNDAAGLNDELRDYQDSESKFDVHSNPSGATFDLGREGQFKGFTVLVGQHFHDASEPGFTMKEPKEALVKKGFNVIITKSESEFLQQLEKADVAWIISDRQANLPPDYVKRILNYHHTLGGLLIWADNAPYTVHANHVLAEMFPYTKCVGSDPGNNKLKIGQSDVTGHFGTHLITSGIISLYEGVTICSTDDKRTPLKTLATNTSGRPAIQFADHEVLKSENYGRVILDHGFTKLWYSWDEAGTARYVVNATVWLLGLEHRARIGVPLTARAKMKDPLRRETFFKVDKGEISAPSVAELLQALSNSIQENPIRVEFRAEGELPESKGETTKVEWSKSRSTDQRRPLHELAKWCAHKKLGHFYLYF